jgi:hypothetical protein
MKVTTLIILLTASIFSTNTFEWQPKDYHGIPADDVKIIFFDGFSDDSEFWKKSDFKKAKVEIENSQCHFSAKEEEHIWQDFVMDKDGFELETSISFGKTKSSDPLHLFIGGTRDKMLTYSIYPDGYFEASLINGESKEHYLSKTRTTNIKQKNNKITIRKVDDILHFFINEKLMASRPFPNISGYRYGFSTSKNDLIINYFIMSDLVRDKRNADFTMKNGEIIDFEERGRYKM